MGDPLQHVQPRDPLKIPAQTFNIFCDAAEDFLKRRRGVSGQGVASRDLHQTGIVSIKNSSGADRDRFDVLGIVGPLFSPTDAPDYFKARVILDGTTPTTASHKSRFAVLLEPVAAGGIALGCVSGVCPAVLNVNTESHVWADVTNNDCAGLNSGLEGGAQILWKESGTGSKLAVVRIGPPIAASVARWIRFQLSEAMGYSDGSATAEVLDYWDGSDPDPEEEGVVAVNCAVSETQYLFGGDVGAIGLACYDPEADQYRIVQLECP